MTIQQESRTLASITFQNYFRLYPKLAGMTGTAKTEEEEFKTRVSNIILDFINLNPQFISILKQNDNVSEFLNLLGVDFII